MNATTAGDNRRLAGHVVVDVLRANGIELAFGVPGESFLPVIDGLYEARDAIRLVVARHEGGAANMAEAYGKLTGRPGICMVTRGPGATQASVGLHTASQDSTPFVLLVGQVATGMAGRETWQEIDLKAMFGGMAKWVDEVRDPARIPELLGRALAVARAGRPGPVVLGLPEDVLYSRTETVEIGPMPRARAFPDPRSLDAMRDLLARAERPLAIVGGGGWDAAGCADLAAFIEAFELPVAAAFRRQDLVDNDSRLYVGHAGLGMSPALRDAITGSDLILAIGARLGETTTDGFTLLDVPRPRQRLIHVHPDPQELGRVYRADLAICADLPAFASAARALRPGTRPAWTGWREEARAAFLRYVTPPAGHGPVDLGAVMLHLDAAMPKDAIVTNGAGNYAIWVHRFHRYRGFRTQLAPTSGAMGYGLPAALAAKLVHPEREVVCFAGDGCFSMAIPELATACAEGLGIVVIVINNGMLGSIRMHQENEFPGRVHATALANPDFAALAKSYGCSGEIVETTAAFPAALARARAAAASTRRPALVEIRIDPEAITPNATLAGLRQASLAKAGRHDG